MSFLLSLSVGAEAAVSMSSGGLVHFSKVTEGIYRGGRPSLADFPELKNYKIKTVIDIQGGDADVSFLGWPMSAFEPGETPEMIQKEETLSRQLGFQFFNYPLSSVKDVDAKEAAMINQVLEVMADPGNQPVFVHCEHGMDRTGLIVALYRVFYQGWSAEKAHDEMLEMGHGRIGNQLLTEDLDDYFEEVTQGH